MRILGIPLGWILHFCYSLVQNYGLALVMFTVLTRLILLPLSIKQQKGMVKMAMFRPKMEEIQKKYAKNPQKMNEELTNLYAREGYNPMSGCLPTLIQFPILFGLIDVIYNPLTHLLRMDAATISNAVSIAQSVLGEGGMSRYSKEMSVISAVAQNPAAFSSIGGDFRQPDPELRLYLLWSGPGYYPELRAQHVPAHSDPVGTVFLCHVLAVHEEQCHAQ